MSTFQQEVITRSQGKKFEAVLLKPKIDILEFVTDGEARVVVYRDRFFQTPYHVYELEFLREDGWERVLILGDASIQRTIDLFVRAKDVARTKVVAPEGDDDE